MGTFNYRPECCGSLRLHIPHLQLVHWPKRNFATWFEAFLYCLCGIGANFPFFFYAAPNMQSLISSPNASASTANFQQRVSSRIAYLKTSGAYSTTVAGKGKGKGMERQLQTWVTAWQRERDQAYVYHTPAVALKVLRADTRHSNLELPADFHDPSVRKWVTLEKVDQPLIVRDVDGEVLFLRTRIDNKYLETLERTDTYVNQRRVENCKRGLFEHRHWINWVDHADRRLVRSSELKEDLEVSLPPANDKFGIMLPETVPERFLSENKGLFKTIENTLRLWMPEV